MQAELNSTILAETALPHTEEILKAANLQKHDRITQSSSERFTNQRYTRREIQSRVEAASKQAGEAELKKIHAEMPNTDLFQVHVQSRLFIKRQKGFHKVYHTLVETILFRSSDKQTQKAILESVRKLLPDYADSLNANIWTQELAPYNLKMLRKKVSCSELAGRIHLAEIKTLSSLKKAVKAARAVANADPTYKPTITITDEKVIIGKRLFTTYIKSANEKSYPSFRFTNKGVRHAIRVDSLKALMEACDITTIQVKPAK
ncbi:MAG: hypothetical protein Q8L72_05135 [Moraxellaceae bacterium]|nr:hypothetical protein [Moraxellaceae bacterium]